jgi:predicted flap endonuclease-1-like 5' DNA nuclease
MNFDNTTLYIIGGVLIAFLILLMILVRRGQDRPRVDSKTQREGYVASTERPYMTLRDTDGAQGNSVADEYATAASDVAGQVLGVDVQSHLPDASGPPDNLTLLKGVGPKFAARLNELGITRFDQIAALNENQVTLLDDKLGPFRGRIVRDKVIEQAGYLGRGDTDGFEARFGKLGSAA